MAVNISNNEQYIRELEAEVEKLREENHTLTKRNNDFQTFIKVFLKAFDNHPMPMAITTLEGGYYEAVNQSYSRILGISKEEMLGKNSLDLGIWIDPKLGEEIGQKLIEGGLSASFESQHRSRSGEIGTAITYFNILEVGGKGYVVTSVVDITEIKKTEGSLQQSHSMFLRAFHDNQTMMAITRIKDGVFYDVNESYAKNLGFEREDMLGRSVQDLCIWMDPEERREMLEQLSGSGYVKEKEYRFKTRTGEVGYVISNVSLLNVDGEECMLISSHNTTELRQYQNEISRLDKLNIMGQMAASIAHEVRNPMTSIKGFIQLFKTQPQYKEDHEIMELMIEELDRVNEIITTFLSLANVNILNLKPQNLNGIIKNILPLITTDALRNDICVQLELSDLPNVIIDRGEIRQMLLNLSRNAIEAMPNGGTLTIKTFGDINGVNLVVSDEGSGIPPGIREKIGTAFFSTKEDGTGLGLAVCFSIAERHNARITIDTSPDGTSFKVNFPVAG